MSIQTMSNVGTASSHASAVIVIDDDSEVSGGANVESPAAASPLTKKVSNVAKAAASAAIVIDDEPEAIKNCAPAADSKVSLVAKEVVSPRKEDSAPLKSNSVTMAAAAAPSAPTQDLSPLEMAREEILIGAEDWVPFIKKAAPSAFFKLLGLKGKIQQEATSRFEGFKKEVRDAKTLKDLKETLSSTVKLLELGKNLSMVPQERNSLKLSQKAKQNLLFYRP